VFDTEILGQQFTGKGSIEADLSIGLDDEIDIDLNKAFDLIKDVKYLAYYWDVFAEILIDEIGEGNFNTIRMPDNVNVEDVIAALDYTYARTGDYPELQETIKRIKDTLNYYKGSYEALKKVWITIMNFKNSPETIFNLASLSATAEFNVDCVRDDIPIFHFEYPIFPPFVTVVVDVKAYYGFHFNIKAGMDADLSGLNLGYVSTTSSGDVGLFLSAGVEIGVNFGFASGGIRGSIIGNPDLTLNAGFTYSTEDGFDPRLDGSFIVNLKANLVAFAEFLGWTKEWDLWESKDYTLGSWTFDLLPDSGGEPQAPSEGDDFVCDVSLEDIQNEPGKIYLPRGPVIATDNTTGKNITIECYDYNNSYGNNPDYEVRYSYDCGNTWAPLTSNNYIEAEPDIIFNSAGDAVAVWTQCCQNMDINGTGVTRNDILADSEIWYAIWRKATGTWSAPAPLTFNLSQPDFHASLSKGPGDNVTIVWIRDFDSNVTTGDDQILFYRIWDGNAWCPEAVKMESNSINYYTQMVDVPDGRILSVWIHDEDENFFTSADQQIMYSVFSDGVWSSPTALTTDDSRKKSITLAGNGDKYMLAWMSKDESTGVYTLFTKEWDKLTGTWSPAEIFNTTDCIMMSPLLAITTDDIAIITWRSNYGIIDFINPETGYIYYSTKDLNGNSGWTVPVVIASTNTFSHFSSTMALDENDDIIYIYCNQTPSGDDRTDPISVTWALAPDLAVSNVLVDGVNNLSMVQGTVAHISARISNPGDINAENVNVSFYSGNPDLGGRWLKSIMIDYLPRLGVDNVTMNWLVENGVNEIFVCIDPSEQVFEHNEANNVGFCTIISHPDLKLTPDDISFSPSNFKEGDPVEVKVDVLNVGLAKANSVVLKLYKGDPNRGGTLVSTKDMGSISMWQTKQTVIIWTSEAGVHEFFAVVESDQPDIDREDNIASNTISVLPDIYIGAGDVALSQPILSEGDEATISVTVRNQGRARAEKVGVKVYTADEFIGYETISSLPVGASITVSFGWTPPEGSYIIYITADPGKQISESNEGNNYQSAIMTVLPSVDLSVEELTITEIEPGKANIAAIIPNSRNGGANDFDVKFYEGNIEIGGRIIKSEIVSNLNGMSSVNITFEWATTPGPKVVYVIVDSLNMIKETNETNNAKQVTVLLTEPESGSFPIWPVILIACLVAVPVTIILLYRRARG
jgi:subtilase family serine protease